jgi:hypothetical protein
MPGRSFMRGSAGRPSTVAAPRSSQRRIRLRLMVGHTAVRYLSSRQPRPWLAPTANRTTRWVGESSRSMRISPRMRSASSESW